MIEGKMNGGYEEEDRRHDGSIKQKSQRNREGEIIKILKSV